MTLGKKKKRSSKGRKTAADFGDKTPADYEREKAKVRKATAKKLKLIDAAKSRSIKLDLAGTHATEPWEQRRIKKEKDGIAKELKKLLKKV